MADTSYPQPNVATKRAAYPPPNVQPVVNEPSIHARAPSMLDIIAHAETGNRNIPQQIHDINTIAERQPMVFSSTSTRPGIDMRRRLGLT